MWFDMTRLRTIRLSLSLKATKIVSGWTLYGVWGVLLSAGAVLHAQQSPEDLEKLARNPVGDAIKIPLAESINFGAGPNALYSNAIRPVDQLYPKWKIGLQCTVLYPRGK
jgi:hypothetical protein